ncbi:MAG: InlB B-repeat-containing protein [Oscillospiraceae bacterium]|nr:InlB B-repeat-containing protein [Oscillospiraceae bacterium]
MKKLTTGLIGLLLALVLCVSLLPVTAQAADTPSVENWNIALKDKIVVNFNVNVPDASNTTISATVNGAAVETSQSVSGNICTVSVSLAAAQLNDSIKLIYNVNGTQSESREYTVKEYADALLNDTYFTPDVAVKQMASQMLSYGGAAQNYFNYNTGAMANAGVDNLYANVTLPTDVPAVSVNDNLGKVRYYGTSLVFRSQVYARFYFVMDDRNAKINNYVVTINGQDCLYGKFYDPEGRFNYFADSPGITPNNYDQQLEVVITNTVDKTTLTVSYSPLNYIVNKASSSTANLPELMKAMYGYHVESYQYVNYENAAETTLSTIGYGENGKGIDYDSERNMAFIFAGANANTLPADQAYYPQSADCIKLLRNGETFSVASVDKAGIYKRSADSNSYHFNISEFNEILQAQGLDPLQDQDVLIVEGKFSADRADTYYDGETMNIAKAYVYVDLSYEEAATITSAEPLLWQTVNVGPFYTHSQSNSYTESQQKPYRYMAADENDMPFEDNCWDYPYMATGNASLFHVYDGVTLQISDGFQYDAHKIALTEEAKSAEPYITMDVQIDTLGGNWENDIEVRFYNYGLECNPHQEYTDLVIFREGEKQTVTLDATKYSVDGKFTGIGIGIFGGPAWDAKLPDGYTPDRHTVTISNVTLNGTQSVDFDLSKSTIKSGTNDTGYTDGNGNGTAVFGENIVISDGFLYDVHKISLVQHTNTYITMDVRIDTLGGNWANDIDVRFYAYNFEGNPHETYTDLVTFREGEKQTVTLDAAKYLVDGKLTGIGIAIFGGPAWDAKLPDGYTPDRHTVSISNVKLEGAQSADFDLSKYTIASGTTGTGFTGAVNGNGKAAVLDYISDRLDVNGLLIKKWGAKDYYIEGGPYDTTTLQNGEYYILEGQFKNDTQRTVINVAKTYIYKDVYIGEISIAEDLPQAWQVVDVGPFYTHAHTYQTHKYLAADPNAAPYYPDWDSPYYSIDSTSLTYVQNGVPTKLDTTGLTIKKYGETDYYIEGGSYDSTVLQNGDYFILEGLFVQRNGEKVAINVAKTYIHKDSDSGEVTIAGKLPTTVNAGVLQTHEVGMNGNGIYFRTAANDAPSNSDWSLEYKQTSADNIKIVRNGETVSIGIVDRPLLVKLNDCDYYLKLEEWTIGAYGLNSTNPITTEDMLIIEGDFFHVKENVTLNITKSYVYYDGGKWVCSAEAPVDVDVVNLESDPANGWMPTINDDEPGGMYFTAAENTAPYNADWSLRYTPTSVDAIKLIRDGVETSIANTGAETIVKYGETGYYMAFWPFGNANPMQAGDILIVEGWFYNTANNIYIDVEKTYFTLFADGTIACTKEMPVSHTINLDANGGSCSTTSFTTTTGGKVTLPDATRTNYTFGGWSDGTTTYAAGTKLTVTSDMNLTAQWTINQYTVNYNYNGGSGSPASATVNAGSATTLPTPTRTGYNFTGWYTAASGGTSVGAAGASYTPTGDVTLYAQWTAINYTIKITTSDKGGSWSGPSTATYGSTVTGTISYSGSKDKVFTVTNDTTGEVIATDSGESVSFTMPASNVTINISSGCLAEGTMITMGDGTQKAIEEIQVGDEILTWSFINGRYEVAPVCLAVADGVNEYTVLTLKFADGTELRIVEIHGIFDVQLNEYVYIDFNNAEQYIGHSFVKIAPDGSVSTTELVDYTVTIEELGCYTLQTAVNVNCIADGILTQTPPLREGYFDYFEMGDFMQYDQEQMQADIEKYGLYTYEDFQDYLTYDAFIAFNGPYLKVAVGKGYFTFEYLVEQIKAFGIGIE